MKKIDLNDFIRGWVVGNFEPSLVKTTLFEVGVQTFKKGTIEAKHVHNFVDEYTFMMYGSAKFNWNIVNENEGYFIPKGEANQFEAITDCKTLVIKNPSVPSDKTMIEND